jgi:DNA-directed RNA polymerase specialized sigma24 family protein
MNTAQLIAGCRAGDARAIELLPEQHQARLFRLALSVLDDPSEVDEAVQVALIAALQGLEGYHGGASLGAWLYSITLETYVTARSVLCHAVISEYSQLNRKGAKARRKRNWVVRLFV